MPKMKAWHVPPPLLFFVAYIAGEILQYLVPFSFAWFVPAQASYVLSIVLLFGGIALVVASVATFKAARTTVVPYQRAATLVMRGPYRATRNPMYVGVTLFYLGVAALRLALWSVLLLPIVLIILNYVVIPQEESLLRETFGAEYERYCARVRRWL